DAYRRVPVDARTWWRRALAFAGPGYLVAVGYMDPGNWATDLAGGSAFGYALLSVILISNLMAILLQGLAAKLGIVTGRDLAQACRDHYSRTTNLALWLLCEVAIAACDLAEVIGSAIALNLLFGIPLPVGIVVTALVHRADAPRRGVGGGQAHGRALRLFGLHRGPHLRAVHQCRHLDRRRGDVPSPRPHRRGRDSASVPTAHAAARRDRRQRRVRVRPARLRAELDPHRDARGPDRDGGVPEHPAAALAAAAHHARHRDCARRPHRYLLWGERHRATPHSQSGDPQP